MAERERTSLEELEKRIRARGVRVRERLALLRLLAEEDAADRLAERRDHVLEELRARARALREELA